MRLAPRRIGAGERIRVMVVDDSVVIRRLVTHALEQEPRIEVVGAASNGKLGLDRIPQWNPDLITLDIEMPEMDGISMLRELQSRFPRIRVVMLSSLTERGAASTLEALGAGADDYVGKIAGGGSTEQSMVRLGLELIPKILQFFPQPAPPPPPHRPLLKRQVRGFAPLPRLLTIGVSTGGPSALAELLPNLPANFPLPVLVVQHMPPMFTRSLAERLNASCPLAVAEARAGMPVAPGTVLIAPGDYHMRVTGKMADIRIALDQEPAVNSCRPSVDVLWHSLAECCGGAVLAVILTGMGQDGANGAAALSARGARIFAQDEASSVVWGMPGAVVRAGLADRVAALAELPGAILSFVQTALGTLA
ncbi:MAG TPA: chemotaxis response regulator protein-glutamate methylesterase [Bryobacteraceae bacterium]|nr:chemotaxis response regulator protein-glutamate methylesterase [Bryobacteraceae bacterium]